MIPLIIKNCETTISNLKHAGEYNPHGTTQPAFAYSKLTMKTLEQGMKYVQS